MDTLKIPENYSGALLIDKLNDIINHIVNEINRLEPSKEQQPNEQQEKNRKFHPLGGDTKVKFAASRIKFKPIDSAKADNNTLFVDTSTGVLYFKDPNGVLKPLHS